MRPKLTAIKVSDRHLVPVIALGLELAYPEQVEAEGLDLSQDAVQRRLVQEPVGTVGAPCRGWRITGFR